MKKKLVILAMLTAVMAFAQKPANVGKVEYLLLKVNATTPYGVEYADELGSKHIRIEMKTLDKTYVMRITQKWPRTNEVQWAEYYLWCYRNGVNPLNGKKEAK